jgi:hypothetical protein
MFSARGWLPGNLPSFPGLAQVQRTHTPALRTSPGSKILGRGFYELREWLRNILILRLLGSRDYQLVPAFRRPDVRKPDTMTDANYASDQDAQSSVEVFVRRYSGQVPCNKFPQRATESKQADTARVRGRVGSKPAELTHGLTAKLDVWSSPRHAPVPCRAHLAARVRRNTTRENVTW